MQYNHFAIEVEKIQVVSEKRQSNNDWTKKYAYVESPEGKPMCLLSNQNNAVAKEYNLRRHFNTTHDKFDANYPPATRFT